MKRLALSIAALGFACAAAPALAQTATKPAPSAPASALDPRALALLKSTSAKLAAATSIAFTVKTAFDQPGRDGQPLLYATQSNVALVRPDRFAVETVADGPRSAFHYDGKDVVVTLPDQGLYAVASMPGSVEAMLEQAFAQAGIYFPWVDFVVADPYAEIGKGLVTAFVVGTSKVVGGVETDVVAFANGNVRAQVWIGRKDGLPRMVAITPVDPSQRGRQMLEFSDWRLGRAIAPAVFRPKLAKSDRKIDFARPESFARP